MAETTKPDESGARRARSPSFPFIPLETAISRLEELEIKFRRHPVPVQKAGLGWKMKEDSSQAAQTLAALKSFGFLKYEGSRDARKALLTDDARTYLRAQQEQIKKDIVRKAALKPKEIAKYWAGWKADPPIDEVRLDDLVLNANYTQDGAKAFLKVYDDTIAYAGLSSSDKLPDEEGPEHEEPEENGDSGEKPPPPPKDQVRIMGNERVVFTDEIEPDHHVRLVVSGAVDKNILDSLEDYVKRQKTRLGIDVTDADKD